MFVFRPSPIYRFESPKSWMEKKPDKNRPAGELSRAAGSQNCKLCGEVHDEGACPVDAEWELESRDLNPSLSAKPPPVPPLAPPVSPLPAPADEPEPGELTIDAEPAEESRAIEGTQIGSYRVLKMIGKGGMAYVYLAVHEDLKRKVALKLLKEAYTARADAVQRVLREALAASRINHPNIVAITDFIQDEETACYVMEYLEGRPLIARLKKGPLPLDEALAIAEQTADGLAALHGAGVIHRDLKPGNIYLVEREGQPVQVKLLDFGLAELSEEVTAGSTDELKGAAPDPSMATPEYCSPEQISSPRSIDHRADIYTFGVVLYMMVVGGRPHQSESDSKLLADICFKAPPSPTQRGVSLPKRLEQLIMSCLSIEPDARPATAKVVLEEIRGIISDRAAALARVRIQARLRWALACLALVILAAGGYTLWRYSSSSPASPASDAAPRPAEVAIASLKTMLRQVQHRPREGVDWAPARKGMELLHLDTIKTGARSHAEVSFHVGGRMKVQEWTTVLIEMPPADEKLPVARLRKGTVHTEVQPGRSLRVISPGGRESLIKAEGDKPLKLRVRQRKSGLELAVLGGMANVKSAGRTAIVKSGQFVDIGRKTMDPSRLLPYPELLSPEVDASVSGGFALSWKAVDRARAYRVQVSRSTTFHDNAIDRRTDKTMLEIGPETLEPNRYIWRVSSIGRGKREGEFGYARRFTVVSDEDKDAGPSEADFTPGANAVVYVIKESAVVRFRWPASLQGQTLLVTRGRNTVVRRRARANGARIRLKPGIYRWKLVTRDGTPAFQPPRRLILKLRKPPVVIPKVHWPGQKNP